MKDIIEEIGEEITNHLDLNCYGGNFNFMVNRISNLLQSHIGVGRNTIFDFLVRCDDSNNPSSIDRSIYVKIDIFIKQHKWSNIVHIEKDYYGSIKEKRRKKLERLEKV